MEIFLILIGILICVVFGWNYYSENERFFPGLLLIVSTFMFTICLDAHLQGNTPNAMDVYRGKTTLEITYRDSIPVDSVVVWKSEFKK